MNHKALKQKFQALASGPISDKFLSLTHVAEEEKAMLEHLKLMCTIQDSSASDNTEEQWSAENSNSFILGNDHM